MIVVLHILWETIRTNDNTIGMLLGICTKQWTIIITGNDLG